MRGMSGTQSLLCEMLSCGTMDLELLDRIGYDWDEVLEQAEWPSVELDFNVLMRAVVGLGILDIREALDDRTEELCWGRDHGSLTDEDAEELRALEQLNPDDDIQSFHNYLDTHVWFEHNGPIYRRYLPEALDAFEENVGFFLTGGED